MHYWGGVALSLFAAQATASSFDMTSKIASGLADGNHYTCGITANTNPAALKCACSPDGTNWTLSGDVALPVSESFSSGGGVYLVPNMTNNNGKNYVSAIVHLQNAPDLLIQYSVNRDVNGNCVVTNQGSIILVRPNNTQGFRAGPREAIALDKAVNPNLWYFFVVPVTSDDAVGHLMAYEVANRGDSFPTDSTLDITTALLGRTFDSTGTPIAAAQTNVTGGDMIVALRNDNNRDKLFVTFRTGGANWNVLTSNSLPNQATIAFSISITETPHITGCAGGNCYDYYEWINVSGSDGHLYSTRLQKLNGGSLQLDNWHDYGTPAGLATIPTSNDALASSWYTNGTGVTYQTIYAATNVHWMGAIEIQADSAVAGSWTNTNGFGPWNFYGFESAVRVSGNTVYHETYGICGSTGQNTCQMRRQVGVNTFTWTNVD